MTQAAAISHGVDATGDAPESVALRVRSLRKSFGGNEVLRGIDLDVRTGEFLTLLGPSGSGKTTLLRIIAGFESHTSGEMLIRGRDIAGLSPSERGLGMVFQQYALFPHLTVADNVAYGLRMRRWARPKVGQRVAEMLEMVGLPDLADRKPRQLSGGQQQRVAFARALAYEPQLLLMDEPLGALDRSLRLQLEEEIKRVHRQLGTTVIYVTHDQEEALVLSDRIAIMEEGRFAGLDTPTTLYQRPPTTFVAKFFANANLIPATATATATTAAGDSGAASIEFRGSVFAARTELRGPVTLAVRPRSLRVEPVTDGLALSGTVVETLLLGDDRQVKFDVPEVGAVVALVDARHMAELPPGAAITLNVPADEITVLER